MLIDVGRRGKYHVVWSSDLPPGTVYAFEPDKIARKLGLWPYMGGPDFNFTWRKPKPWTDDMRQMLDDLKGLQ